jgi:hypothetical protein
MQQEPFSKAILLRGLCLCEHGNIQTDVVQLFFCGATAAIALGYISKSLRAIAGIVLSQSLFLVRMEGVTPRFSNHCRNFLTIASAHCNLRQFL